MECKAIGVVAIDNLEDIEERLVGLSGTRGERVLVNEYVLQNCVPNQIDLHVQQRILTSAQAETSAEERWSVAQYRLPLAGKAAAELPATVRSVLRTNCRGPDVLGFWKAVGYKVHYQMAKKGLQFVVEHGQHEIQVFLCQILRLPVACQGTDGNQLDEVVPGHWLVEAVAAVEGGEYKEIAAALGSLSKLLMPLTELRPLATGRRR